ncbi:unnamed protein product, partial [Adineta ricciae]
MSTEEEALLSAFQSNISIIYSLVWLTSRTDVMDEYNHLNRSLQNLINDSRIFQEFNQCEMYLNSSSADSR